MSEQDKEFDVEGHRIANIDENDDTEGHRLSQGTEDEEDEDVEGHVQPPRDTDLGNSPR